MIWVQAALETRAEGTASSVAHTRGGSAVRTMTVSGLGWLWQSPWGSVDTSVVSWVS